MDVARFIVVESTRGQSVAFEVLESATKRVMEWRWTREEAEDDARLLNEVLYKQVLLRSDAAIELVNAIFAARHDHELDRDRLLRMEQDLSGAVASSLLRPPPAD